MVPVRIARRDAAVSLVARAEVGLGWQILSRLAGPSFFTTLARLQHLVREHWRVQSRQNECLEMWILTRSLQYYIQPTIALHSVQDRVLKNLKKTLTS